MGVPVSTTFMAVAVVLAVGGGLAPARPVHVREDFHSDPGWEGIRNRLRPDRPPVKRQDFGYQATNRAGGQPGELGGTVWRSLRPAYYAKVLKPLTLESPLTASGTLALTQATAIRGYQTGSDLFVGFFNAAEQGWRPPNFLGFRLTGSNDPDGAYIEVSYGTSRWEADGAFVNAAGGAQAKNVRDLDARALLRIAPDGAPHTWSIAYDPKAEGGRGALTFTFDGADTVQPLRPEHRGHGAAFDRFGIFNCQLAGNEMTVYLDDLAILGEREDFARDPGWDAKGNREAFEDPAGYGFQNFGYCPAGRQAGGAPGEIGGRFWLVEEPELSGSYGAPIGRLSLQDRLEAGGRIAAPKFSIDSAVLFGWYNSRETAWPPRDFVGIYMETFTPIGPYLAPLYGTSEAESTRTPEGKKAQAGWDAGEPELLFSPDGRSHMWRIFYNPEGNGGDGLLTVELDGRRAELKLKPGDKAKGASLDRFGILNAFGANGKYAEVYWDDITYTSAEDARKRRQSRAVGPQSLPVALESYAGVRYVSQATGADRTANGSSRAPWATLQRAWVGISDAGPDRRYAVLVAAGTYVGETLVMKPYVDLYGGFEPSGWRRDLEAHATFLCGGEARRVVVGADNARLDGFTLSLGRSDGHGGALLCDGTSPAIVHNRFVGNKTRVPAGYRRDLIHQIGNEGGAIACLNGASPLIAHNVFAGNGTGVGGGGGIACRIRSAPTIAANVLYENVAGRDDAGRTRSSNGGAISCSGASPTIEGNVMTRNHAGGRSDGGGIYCEYEASPEIVRNRIVGNSAEDDGGGIYVMRSSEPRIAANVIAGNTRSDGIRLSKDGRAHIENNLFLANGGDGVNCVDSWMVFAHNTVVGHAGPGVAYTNRTAYFKPSIIANALFHGNAGGAIVVDTGEAPLQSHCFGDRRGNGGDATAPDPCFLEDGWSGTATLPAATFARPIDATTRIQVPGAGWAPDRWVGRAVRIGSTWSVVRANDRESLEVWGDVTEGSMDPQEVAVEIARTYRLRAESPCVDAGVSEPDETNPK